MGKRVTYPHRVQRPFFAEWREKRGWTQGEVSERLADIGVECSVGQLSRYETGEVRYGQDILHALADIHGVDPEDLISINPLVPRGIPHLVYDALKRATPEKQAEALRIVEALLKAS